VERLLQDVRYAIRILRRSPGFTVVAVLLLALAIGANVTIFTFVDAALLRPLPYDHPEQLMKLWDARQSQISSRFEVSYPDYLDWKAQNQAFSSLAGYATFNRSILSGAHEPEIIRAGRVSDNFFQTLGVQPVLGRTFRDGEDAQSSPWSVILTYGSWERRFGGKPDVIGQSLTINGKPTSIVGVLPRNFHFAPVGDPEMFLPLHPSGGLLQRRNLHWMHPLGRLKPGVTQDQAQVMMDTVASNLEREYPDSNRELRAVVQPLTELITGQIKPILLVLLAAVGLLLLIACANIANLLLARAAVRAKEMALRAALGARRWRVVRQLLTEGIVLVSVGAALGIAFAMMATRLMVQSLPLQLRQSMPYLKDAGIEPRTLLFCAALAILTALLFSLAPALRLSNPVLNDVLKEGGRLSNAGGWKKFGSSLVVAEVAISAVLLAGSGLMLKSLYRLLTVDTGFNARHLTTFTLIPTSSRYDENAPAIVFHQNVMEKLLAIPGVTAAGTTSVLPVSGGNTSLYRVVGAPMTPLANEANSRTISPGYFPTLGARFIAGRNFDERDSEKAPQVVIINKTLAKAVFGSEDPVGKQIVFTYNAQQKPREIVGVVGDIHEGALDSGDKPAIYTPFAQSPNSAFDVVVRSQVDPTSVRSAMEKAVHDVDPEIVVFELQTMEDLIAQSPAAALHRYPAWLVSMFAMSALLLGIVGLYGIVSYSVSQRTPEIGIRMALGAQRSNVLWLVLSGGLRLALCGIIAGVLGAVAAGYLLRSVLFGVQPWDGAVLAAVAVMLALIGTFASYVPARRASRLDPMRALHYE
jgi:macrolide transport system ATP-binding/permease protein